MPPDLRSLIGAGLSYVPSRRESRWFQSTETFVLKAQGADIAAQAAPAHRRRPVRPADRPDIAQIDACQPGDDRRLHRGIDEVFAAAKVDIRSAPSYEPGLGQQAKLAAHRRSTQPQRAAAMSAGCQTRSAINAMTRRRVGSARSSMPSARRGMQRSSSGAGRRVEDALFGLSADHHGTAGIDPGRFGLFRRWCCIRGTNVIPALRGM